MQNFLCLSGYHRRFVDEYASITSPLTTLTQIIVKFELTEVCEEGFQKLKYKFTSATFFNIPEGSKGFVMNFDASRVGLGCVPHATW